MARSIIFEKFQPYHILNRGTDKRVIFQEEADYYRFIFLLYACNFGSPALNLWRKDTIKAGKAILAGENPPSKFIQSKCEQLIDILAVCLIPNHFHLILEQRVEKGISLFMQKIGIAYSKYFNLKNQRSGRLFQGPFKAILIDNENYLLRVSRYVHLNPLDLIQSDWRIEEMKNQEEAMRFLTSYPWSSLPDYLGVRNSKLITTKGLYNVMFDNFSEKGESDYKNFLTGWTEDEFKNIQALTID